MKKDIHPDYVDDPGDLHLRQPVHDPEHRRVRHHPRRRLLAVPPVLHRQAEDPRHRRPRGPLRGSLRQEGSLPKQPSPSAGSASLDRRSIVRRSLSTRARACSRQSRARRRARRARAAAGRAGDPRRPAPGQDGSTSGTPSCRPSSRPIASGSSSATTSRPRASSPARTRRSPTEADELSARGDAAEERLQRLLVPRDPTDAKDAILEVKSGEGGEESALFAGDLLRMYTRYAERARLEDRGPRRHRVRPRRLQVGDRGGEGQGHARSPARRRTPC